MNNVNQSSWHGATTRQVRQNPKRQAPGFTLIELLVVIAIILLLATFLIPSVSTVNSIARYTQCKAHLGEIGKAVKLFEAQEGGDSLQVLKWQTMLSTYLGDTKEGMICPEYSYIQVTEGVEDVDEPSPVPLKYLAAFRVQKANTVYYDDLDRGAQVAKLSESNYAAARAHPNKYLGNDNSADNFPRATYEDGSEDLANTYWLCLEDYGGDWDYKDIMVRVSFTGNGYLLESSAGSTAHTNSIVDKPDHTQLQRVPRDTAFGSLPAVTVSTTGVVASYGMNMSIPDSLDRSSTVMVMDYHWVVASTSDQWADYEHPDNAAVPVFARHRQRMNAVFVDGGVKTVHPNELNPNTSAIEQVYWLP